MTNALAQVGRTRACLPPEIQTSGLWSPSSNNTPSAQRRSKHPCFSRLKHHHRCRLSQVARNADALLRRFRGRMDALAQALQSKYGVSAAHLFREQRHLSPVRPATEASSDKVASAPVGVRYDTYADTQSDIDTTHSPRFLPSFLFRWCKWPTVWFVRSSFQIIFSSRDIKQRVCGWRPCTHFTSWGTG